MTKRWGVWPVLLALPFVEIAVTVLLTRWLGAIWTFALFAVPALIGLSVQWLRYPEIKRIWNESGARLKELGSESKDVLTHDDLFQQQFSEVIFYWIATVLLLIPGLVTHLIAFALIWAPTKRWIMAYPGKYQVYDR